MSTPELEFMEWREEWVSPGPLTPSKAQIATIVIMATTNLKGKTKNSNIPKKNNNNQKQMHIYTAEHH